MPLQEVVDRREERITHRLLLPGRIEQLQQRRQHRDGGGERDQHACACDLAELGNTLVVGRYETEEAGRGGHRRQRQRHGGAAGRLFQRLGQIVVLEALGSVADAVLDAEVDAEADEQHCERNRQQVQRTHHQQPDRRRDRQADEQVDEDGEDDLGRMQREPEDQQDHQDRADAVGDRAVLHGGVFLIGDRDRAGQANPRLIFAREIQLRRSSSDRIGCVLAGLQCIEIEHRLELDEGALVGIGQRLVAGQRAPGKIGVALVEDILDRLRDHVEGPRGAVELDVAALDADKSRFQRAGQPADGRIARHDLDQGCCRLELAGDLAELLGRQEQQAVLVEELTRAERRHRLEVRGVALQFLLEGGRRGACQLRRRRIDHGQNRAVAIERLVELLIAQPPVQLRGNQRVDVSVDGEMLGCVIARDGRENEPNEQRQSGKSGTGSDDLDDYACQHTFSF